MSTFERCPKINGRSEKVTITLFEDTIDGLLALNNWCHGYTADEGQIPGHFELVMHLRQLRDAINENRRIAT